MKNLAGFLFLFIFIACEDPVDPCSDVSLVTLEQALVGSKTLNESEIIEEVPLSSFFSLKFSQAVDPDWMEASISLKSVDGGTDIPLDLSILPDGRTILANFTKLQPRVNYELTIIEWSEKQVSCGGFSEKTYQIRTKGLNLSIVDITSEEESIKSTPYATGVPLNFIVDILFSASIPNADFGSHISLLRGTDEIPLEFSLSPDGQKLTVSSSEELEYLKVYDLNILNSLPAPENYDFTGFALKFYTDFSPTPVMPLMSDDDLLTLIQEQTFKYFWDFAHPVSGLMRERVTSNQTVTIGGSGFGIMSIIVGVERGFITREQALTRLETIVAFLGTADRFHGVWPHWMNGTTGETIKFSANDDGADLVETAFMIQGLLTVRSWLDPMLQRELTLSEAITTLWEEVEWTWFQNGNQDVLIWHWSPNFGFEKNLRIQGWNESLIVYVLAAASPTYPIDKQVYVNGWARNGAMKNGNSYYGVDLPLGSNRGGPLFFSHYSFLGLDPRNLEDEYANYMDQNIAHSLINQKYCIDNPLNYVAYGPRIWGLTASDSYPGYSAHSPNNDRGVISPTAAVSAIPYTPTESLEAIRTFYFYMGDRLWGEYGFYDAFDLTEEWVASSFLAIDQGPQIIMIENYRTALLWNLFMQDTEIQAGLDKLGFTSY